MRGQDHTRKPALAGCHILVVEDEFLIALDVETSLVAEQAAVTIASSGKAAIEQLDRGRPDLVVLDVNLSGSISARIARRLQEEDIPFVIASGDQDALAKLDVPPGTPLVAKPFQPVQLIAALSALRA